MTDLISSVSGLRGTVTVPGDKSISHRAVMLGALSSGMTHITGFLMGEDCLSTISCFRKMGVDITISDEEFSEGKAQIVAYYANLYGITEDEVKASYGDESIRMLMLSNKFLEAMFDRNVGNATYK